MKVHELIKAYSYNMTDDVIIKMESNTNNQLDARTIFNWNADDNRHPDDGSYANPLWYMPDDIATAEVTSFNVVPHNLVIDNHIYNTGKTDTLYIIIPSYSKLYRYFEDDNYPFI